MHQHVHATEKLSIRPLLFAMGIILFFAIVELLGGFWTHSLALLSDAGHMFADALALLLAVFTAWISTNPPSDKHSYGLGRAEVIGAWVSSLMLLFIVVMVVYEALHRLFYPPAIISAGWMIIIAAIGLLSNLLAAYILQDAHNNLNIRAAILHVLSDAIGSVAAIVAGLVIYFSGWMPIDPLLSILISILIFIAAIRILRDSLHVLMEGVPTHLDLKKIGMRLATINGVASVHDLHIWHFTSTQIMLTAHIEVSNFNEWPTILTHLQNLIADEFEIHHVTLQPEVKSSELYNIQNT